MRNDEMELFRGSGNVFEDFGYPDAEVRQAKALLAAEIIKVLDAESLSTRQAEARTGIAHAEFSRIRNVKLERFTLDRLLMPGVTHISAMNSAKLPRAQAEGTGRKLR